MNYRKMNRNSCKFTSSPLGWLWERERERLRRTQINETTIAMEEALAELERVQTQILQRISALELSHLLPHHSRSAPTPPPSSSSSSSSDSDTEARLSSILRAGGVRDFSFKKVPSDYYDWPLEARRQALDAASVHHLCKSIVLVLFFFFFKIYLSLCTCFWMKCTVWTEIARFFFFFLFMALIHVELIALALIMSSYKLLIFFWFGLNFSLY